MPNRLLAGATLAFALLGACSDSEPPTQSATLRPDLVSRGQTKHALTEGQRIFREDTFGDETFWTDTLRMHEVISTAVSPNMALSVGLKVDADALPAEIKAGIVGGTSTWTSRRRR